MQYFAEISKICRFSCLFFSPDMTNDLFIVIKQWQNKIIFYTEQSAPFGGGTICYLKIIYVRKLQ